MVSLVDDLIGGAKAQEGWREATAYLFVHSAGGQFLSRVAAYRLPPRGRADHHRQPPMSGWMPRKTLIYGCDRLTRDGAKDDMLRAYLAAPVTVFLGREGTGSARVKTASTGT